MVNNPYTAVIVEDEPSAREALKVWLHKYCPQVEVTGEAADARQAIEILHRLRPQLVFLDVELPFGNAFDVLDACAALEFETIFVTAYSEYAIRALNLSAAYYLLKPLSIEGLVAAVEKATENLSRQWAAQRNALASQNFRETRPARRQVMLPTLEGFEVIRMEEIVRLQGNGNFTDIYLMDGTRKMACRFLKHYDEILSLPFIRVHKSHIINLECVKAYHKNAGGYVVLTDNSEIDISPSYKDQFLSHFK